jgi:hypothetical protein
MGFHLPLARNHKTRSHATSLTLGDLPGIGCQQSSGLGEPYALAVSARRASHCKAHCVVHTPTCGNFASTHSSLFLHCQARPPPAQLTRSQSFASVTQTLHAMDLLAHAFDHHACDTTRVLFLRATTLVKRDRCVSDQVLQLVTPTL